MPPRSGLLRSFLANAMLMGLAGLATVPVTLAVEPANRPVVIRIVAGVALSFLFLQIHGAARRVLDGPPSAFEQLLRTRRAEPADVDRRMSAFLDDVRFGTASQHYWQRVVWPRLCALADRLPGRPVLAPPARSRLRRLLGRGPTVGALRALVARLEERP